MVFQCYYIISVNMQVGEIKVPCTKNFFNYQLYVEKFISVIVEKE